MNHVITKFVSLIITLAAVAMITGCSDKAADKDPGKGKIRDWGTSGTKNF